MDKLENEENPTQECLPIRAVVEKTGIQAVTLRAWERRYGLIKPKRTPKGHRVYTMEDVINIQKITAWLDKGVAVSRVKSLLEKPITIDDSLHNDYDHILPLTDTLEEDSHPDSENWIVYQKDFFDHIVKFNESQISKKLQELTSLYPLYVIYEQLILPAYQQLRIRWQKTFGASAERNFFFYTLEHHYQPILAHNNRNHYKIKRLKGAPSSSNQLVVTNLCEDFDPIISLMIAVMCSQSGYKVTYLKGKIAPLNELHVVLEHIDALATVLIGDKHLENKTLKHDLPLLLKNQNTQWIFIGESLVINANDLSLLSFNYCFENLKTFNEFLTVDTLRNHSIDKHTRSTHRMKT